MLQHRDELFIATKAGYDMWPGPYGNLGSKKYLIASLDQSLKRMGLDYVDVFYHHRPDPNTPIEETMQALHLMVQQGKALYVGLSNYNVQDTLKAQKILKALGTPVLIHQNQYSMFHRTSEQGLFDGLIQEKMGGIVFSPLAQGMLTDNYLNGIPNNSRAAKNHSYLETEQVKQNLDKIKKLNLLAQQRGQKLSQMAIAWIFQQKAVTSVLLGASSPEQLLENSKALKQLSFSDEELHQIESILS